MQLDDWGTIELHCDNDRVHYRIKMHTDYKQVPALGIKNHSRLLFMPLKNLIFHINLIVLILKLVVQVSRANAPRLNDLINVAWKQA